LLAISALQCDCNSFKGINKSKKRISSDLSIFLTVPVESVNGFDFIFMNLIVQNGKKNEQTLALYYNENGYPTTQESLQYSKTKNNDVFVVRRIEFLWSSGHILQHRFQEQANLNHVLKNRFIEIFTEKHQSM
jgi:hypothetical protein